MSPVPSPSSSAPSPQLIEAKTEVIDPPAVPSTAVSSTAGSSTERPTSPAQTPQRLLHGTPPVLTSPPTPPTPPYPPPADRFRQTDPAGYRPQAGSAAHAAPVSPPAISPSIAAAATSAEVVKKRRSPLLIATGAFALGGIVGAGAFGLGMNYGNGGSDTAGSVVNVAAPAVDRSSGSTGTQALPVPGTSNSEDPNSNNGAVPFGAEPAADVARILGPSVVQVETNLGQGSGVVYADGLLLTNHHVIEGASQVQIRTSDGRVFETEVLGSDARNDIAVLSAPGSDLPIATLGSSAALQPGQLTVAIGSPFQLQQTVTSGIVSSVNRPVPNATGSRSAMIQTDAPINPGNSGGALANRNGELVGINASIRTDGTSNSNVGIGFAVPIDTAIRVAERIVSGESLDPGTLGVRGQRLDDGIGVPITEVIAGSSAEAAGLLSNDRVVTIEGAPVTGIEELSGLVQSYFVGDTVRLEIIRGETEMIIEAVLR
ncbi:MAG: S1C family serine protease [Acidimicrobiales bacterium]